MNSQSSTLKIIISALFLVVVLVGTYFSVNKETKMPTENLVSAIAENIATSTGTTTLPVAALSNSSKPIIKKIDYPTSLSVGQEGTWTIHASSTDGKGLTYSVKWGDETNLLFSPNKIKSPTFVHSYNYPGVFNPVFTIYGDNGESVYASVGIRILGESTKAPVIYSLSPSSATVGTLITIDGAGFTSSKPIPNEAGTVPSNEVILDGESLDGVASSGVNSLYFLIPNTVKPGKHSIQVKNSNGKSNVISLIVIK